MVKMVSNTNVVTTTIKGRLHKSSQLDVTGKEVFYVITGILGR